MLQCMSDQLCLLQLYIAPVTEHFETKYMNDDSGVWAVKNWLIRTVIRCSYIFFAALIAAMFPYFGDILGQFCMLCLLPTLCVRDNLFYQIVCRFMSTRCLLYVSPFVKMSAAACTDLFCHILLLLPANTHLPSYVFMPHCHHTLTSALL